MKKIYIQPNTKAMAYCAVHALCVSEWQSSTDQGGDPELQGHSPHKIF